MCVCSLHRYFWFFYSFIACKLKHFGLHSTQFFVYMRRKTHVYSFSFSPSSIQINRLFEFWFLLRFTLKPPPPPSSNPMPQFMQQQFVRSVVSHSVSGIVGILMIITLNNLYVYRHVQLGHLYANSIQKEIQQRNKRIERTTKIHFRCDI